MGSSWAYWQNGRVTIDLKCKQTLKYTPAAGSIHGVMVQTDIDTPAVFVLGVILLLDYLLWYARPAVYVTS